MLWVKVAEGYVHYTVMLLAVVCLLSVGPTLTYGMSPPCIPPHPQAFKEARLKLCADNLLKMLIGHVVQN